MQKIMELGEAAGQRKSGTDCPMIFNALTEREYEIVLLMAEHLTNREIAGKLFLSEGSVKQYINRIYSKLHIEGNARSKRKRLLTLLSQKT
ncbi:MAG: response regulator transcription factor [Agathobacter sp.]